MKPANSYLLKELKTNKMLQRKLGSTEFKLKLKDQMTNRQRIGLSVTADMFEEDIHFTKYTFMLNSLSAS